MSGSRIETYVNFLSFNLDEKTAGKWGNHINAYFENIQRLNTYYYFEVTKTPIKQKSGLIGAFLFWNSAWKSAEDFSKYMSYNVERGRNKAGD